MVLGHLGLPRAILKVIEDDEESMGTCKSHVSPLEDPEVEAATMQTVHTSTYCVGLSSADCHGNTFVIRCILLIGYAPMPLSPLPYPTAQTPPIPHSPTSLQRPLAVRLFSYKRNLSSDGVLFLGSFRKVVV